MWHLVLLYMPRPHPPSSSSLVLHPGRMQQGPLLLLMLLLLVQQVVLLLLLLLLMLGIYSSKPGRHISGSDVFEDLLSVMRGPPFLPMSQ